MNIKTRQRRLLTHFGYIPIWSPDGHHIVFLHFTKPTRLGLDRGAELWIVPIEGGEPRKLADGFRHCWSADSKHIYYQDESEGNLYRISINERHPRHQLIMEYPVKYKYRNRVYYPNELKTSPNERYLAYDNFKEVRIQELGSDKPFFKFPIRLPSEFTHLSWSADSRYLFISLNPHIAQIGISNWILDIERCEAHQILDHPVRQIVQSPNVSQALLSINNELWLVDIDPNLLITESLGPAQNWDQYLDQKKTWLDQCLSVESTNAVYYLLRALVYIDQSEYEKAQADLRRCTNLIEQFNDPIINWFRWYTHYFVHTDRFEIGEVFAEETINMIERFPMSIKILANTSMDPFDNLMRIYAIQKDNTKILECLAREETIRAKISVDQQHASLSKEIYKPGNTQYNQATNDYTITGVGRDIWSVYDQFHLSYKELNGDGSITVRIDKLQDVHAWTKAGIMIRDGLEPCSAYVGIFVTPSGRVSFTYRPELWSDSESVHTGPNSITLPHWIRLTRQDNRFIGEHSHDGVQWEIVQSNSAPNIMATTEIEMPEEVYIGLAAMSHEGPSVTAEAKISNVQVIGSVSPDGPFIKSMDIGFPISEILHTR